MNQPDITIVVCTFNRANLLPGALASLYDLATDGRFTYEVLVVDNASTDATPDVIAAAAAKSKNPLRGVRETRKGISPARNRGVQEARGRWIAFFDDDQLADHRWLAELRNLTEAKQCRVVGGAVHLQLPAGCQRQLAPMCRMLLGESRWSPVPLQYAGKINPGCGNLMVERTVFDEIGVFDESLRRGEDTDLFRRMTRAGIAAWYSPTAIVEHVTPAERMTDAYLLGLSRGMGEGIAVLDHQKWGLLKFIVATLAKALRSAARDLPALGFHRLLGNREAAIDDRCRLALARGHFRQALKLLFSSPAGPPASIAAPIPLARSASEGIPLPLARSASEGISG